MTNQELTEQNNHLLSAVDIDQLVQEIDLSLPGWPWFDKKLVANEEVNNSPASANIFSFFLKVKELTEKKYMVPQ